MISNEQILAAVGLFILMSLVLAWVVSFVVDNAQKLWRWYRNRKWSTSGVVTTSAAHIYVDLPAPKPYPDHATFRADVLNPDVSIDTILDRAALGVPPKPENPQPYIPKIEMMWDMSVRPKQEDKPLTIFNSEHIKAFYKSGGTIYVDTDGNAKPLYQFKPGDWVHISGGAYSTPRLAKIERTGMASGRIQVSTMNAVGIRFAYVSPSRCTPAYPRAGEWWFHDKSKNSYWVKSIYKYDNDDLSYAERVRMGWLTPINYGCGDERCKPKDGTCA